MKFICDEDIEDYEQELRIKEWLNREGIDGFELKHITRNGTARNTRVRASISLDQKISEDSTGTFADLIAGSDGRDYFFGEECDEGSKPDKRELLKGYLSEIGFLKGEIKWLMEKMLLR